MVLRGFSDDFRDSLTAFCGERGGDRINDPLFIE